MCWTVGRMFRRLLSKFVRSRLGAAQMPPDPFSDLDAFLIESALREELAPRAVELVSRFGLVGRLAAVDLDAERGSVTFVSSSGERLLVATGCVAIAGQMQSMVRLEDTSYRIDHSCGVVRVVCWSASWRYQLDGMVAADSSA